MKTLVVCNRNNEIINMVGGEQEFHEYIEDYDSLSENYYDAVIMAGCDLQTELRNIANLYPKLKLGGEIYVDNLLTDFNSLLDSCSIEKGLIEPIHFYSLIAKDLDYKLKAREKYIAFVKQRQIPPILLPGLKNMGATSCFMDSVLFAILFPRQGYFKELLEKDITLDDVKTCSNYIGDLEAGVEYLYRFQRELSELADNMRNGISPNLTCKPIIKMMKKCGSITKELMSGDEQDDSEFLIALMQMYNLEPTTVVINKELSNDKINWVTITNDYEKQSVLEINLAEKMDASAELVSWYQRVVISDYQEVPESDRPRDSDGNTYRYMREKTTINDSKALIFHVSRRQIKDGEYIKNTTEIDFTQYIEKTPKEYYALQAVTVHHGDATGGHYTAFFKYGGDWFHYDDLKDERVKITSWQKVQKKARSNGSLFIYQ